MNLDHYGDEVVSGDVADAKVESKKENFENKREGDECETVELFHLILKSLECC